MTQLNRKFAGRARDRMHPNRLGCPLRAPSAVRRGQKPKLDAFKSELMTSSKNLRTTSDPGYERPLRLRRRKPKRPRNHSNRNGLCRHSASSLAISQISFWRAFILSLRRDAPRSPARPSPRSLGRSFSEIRELSVCDRMTGRWSGAKGCWAENLRFLHDR